MSDIPVFNYKTLAELAADIKAQQADIPLTEDLAILRQPVQWGAHTIPNRMSIHPMEGCDGDSRGTPSDLTVRRYKRFAAGGAGLLWMEATAAVPEGRANPRQIMLHKDNLATYRDMVAIMRTAAQQAAGHDPFLVLQMTHSGRYSRPGPKPAPMIAHHSKVLDPRHNLPPDYPLVDDAYLDRLQDHMVAMAILARDAGFNAVDIKSCHRYLVAELHASFTRENSKYGGSYENRTRFLKETVQKIMAKVPDIEVTCRLNAFDGIEYPFGFGVDKNDPDVPDLAEPLQLIGELQALGVHGINITIGNPYSNPHVGRPYDQPIIGFTRPPYHPLFLVSRFVQVVRQIQETYPKLCVIGGGYSWLREYYPHAAAAAIGKGWASIIGVGRTAFAYPDFALDIRDKGRLDPLKVCVTCSSCTQIMRDGGRAGCVLKDAEVYGPIFREGRQRAQDTVQKEAQRCRDCNAPTCREGCPARVDIPGFVKLTGEGRFQEAYNLLRERNPLPELCALVCPTAEQCEGHCIYSILEDNPVRIGSIQYFVSRLARTDNFKLPVADPLPYTIAVIGSGPCGLACADKLGRSGCAVTVFEKESIPGGTVRTMIPADKIGFTDIDAEIAYIISSNPNIKVETGRELGRNLAMSDLDTYDAVFLAMGLPQGGTVIEERPEGVTAAIEFLARVKAGKTGPLPEVVCVIGGGNTALDAATGAVHAGARDVYVFYRRTLNEMPAWHEEYRKAVNAGVNFMILTQPVGYQHEGGRLTGMTVARTELGEPDAAGRRKPVKVEGSEYFFPCGLVIEAAGQGLPDHVRAALKGITFSKRGLVGVAEGSFRTSDPHIFAGGDTVNGGTTAVQAVAEGLAAGKEILSLLQAGSV